MLISISTIISYKAQRKIYDKLGSNILFHVILLVQIIVKLGSFTKHLCLSKRAGNVILRQENDIWSFPGPATDFCGCGGDEKYLLQVIIITDGPEYICNFVSTVFSRL